MVALIQPGGTIPVGGRHRGVQLSAPGGCPDIAMLAGLQAASLSNYGGEGVVVTGGYAYIIGETRNVQKIDLSTLSLTATLTALSVGATAEAIETDGTYLYVSEWSSPAKITRVRLSDFTFVDRLTLNSGENLPSGMHIKGTNLYVGCWTSPGIIVKIDLTNFTRTAALSLNSGENHAEKGDDDGTYLYWPCELSRHIVRIQLSDFTRVDSTQLNSTETEPQECLVYGGYVYIPCRITTSGESIGKVVRIPTADFQRASGSAYSTINNPNVIWQQGGYLYLGSDADTVGRPIVRIDPATWAVRADSATLVEMRTLALSGYGAHGEGITSDGTYIYLQSRNVANSDSQLYRVPICKFATASITLRIQPDPTTGRDAYIADTIPDGVRGNGTTFFMGESNGDTLSYRGLIAFDELSNIPSTATIVSATLTLTLASKSESSTASRTFRCYRLKRPFIEAANANPGTVGTSWNKYDIAGNLSWQTAGAKGANDAEATDIGSFAAGTSSTLNAAIDVTLTPSAVQEWISGAFTNNGLLIYPDTNSDDAVSFYSSDYTTDPLFRPKLTVVYTV